MRELPGLATFLTDVRAHASGARALESLRSLVRFHRIQSSPGYDEAADWLEREARALGAEVEVLRPVADGVTRYGGVLLPRGWRCERASARLFGERGEEALCDFSAEPLSLVQRSAPARGRYPLVLDRGPARRARAPAPALRGAIVLTSQPVHRAHEQAVLREGAAGLLSFGRRLLPPVRGVEDERDALPYTSFWWSEGMAPGWGFVVTPERAAELGSRLAAGERLEVEVNIESEFFATRAPLLTARIPGARPERGEILVLAHLCHPAPGANDNGSGVVAALETLRVLCELRRKRRWRPRASVRFLWMPEIHGTAAWLALRPQLAKRTRAALNLDMVGADQHGSGSVFLLEHPPHFAASFAEEWLARIRRDSLDWVESYSGPGHVTHTRIAEVPYSGGSDHALLVDPVIGVPCPMLIQWPDRHYHSNHDTVDHCSADSLALAIRCAAGYAGSLASGGAELLRAVADVTERGAARRLLDALAGGDARAMARERDRGAAAIGSLARLAVSKAVVGAALRRFERIARAYRVRATPRPRDSGGAQRVPVRILATPLDLMEHLLPGYERLTQSGRAAWRRALEGAPGAALAFEIAWLACDGRRTLTEIARRVGLETGRPCPVGKRESTASLERFFERTAKLGMSGWRGGI